MEIYEFINWKGDIAEHDDVEKPDRRQAITWTNDGPVHWRIYAAPGGDEWNLATTPILS